VAYALASAGLNDIVSDFHLMIAGEAVRVVWDFAAAAAAVVWSSVFWE
jgi:hypothetical protein